ncbi:hypothetical protein MKW98_015591 [Papaver atlanticum]|uniref:DNA-directed DNA polymerase n=1 Tax=Papaver atlanticum TaxID=357466 RepID=A0AAD4S4K1_9MAGN|nr:hypothetical protein MKW98_015591 [Papaver atlanticum]
MAAMGVSTHRNPFKPCFPPSLLFSSSKSFQRRDFHLLQGANSKSSRITILKSSLQFNRRLTNCTRSFEEDRVRMIGVKQPYALPQYGNEGTHTCFHEQLELNSEDVSLSRSSDYGNPTGIFTGVVESKNYPVPEKREKKKSWLDEINRMKLIRQEGAKGKAIQSSSRGDDVGIEKASISLLETNGNGSSGTIRHSRFNNVTVNEPHSISYNRNAEISRYNHKLDQVQGASSFVQIERKNFQSKESSEGKQRELREPKLSESPIDRLKDTIAVGSSNGKRIAISSNVNETDTCLVKNGVEEAIAINHDVNETYIQPLSDGEEAFAISDEVRETYVQPIKHGKEAASSADLRENLSRIYDEVLVVDNISTAKEIVKMLTTQEKYKNRIYACDTEVCKIDVKTETPVDHGEVTCFSIYAGEGVDFGNGKSCIWVDVLDGGGRDMMMEFAPFFEDPSIKKVWHNYSFDSHVIDNYGLKISGFHADTMHMARLWDSSRRLEGGYSLEALTSDPRVMNGNSKVSGSRQKKVEIMPGINQGKISMKTIFGKGKLKKDGSEGKIIAIAPVEELQREERMLWVCYSSLDSISTLKLYESLEKKLKAMEWILDGIEKGNMYDFYEEYWRPFGEILVNMETEGMLVNREALADMEKLAIVHQQVAGDKFRQWASKMCPDALFMNIGSDTQLRQLFFGGMTISSKDGSQTLDEEKEFKVPNVDKVIEEGKKVATKFRKITLHKIGNEIKAEIFTPTGRPSVSGDVLKVLAGKVTSEYKEDIDVSQYGTAYKAFGEGKKGREACHAIAALCEVCAIDSLISNFILPLQSSAISGKDDRIHCSLNINTETGRLSARRPNLQNQPALEKDIYKIRQAFVAGDNNSLIVADYGQLELRILAHLADCKSMLDAFKAGGDFHSRTAINMYPHIRKAVEQNEVLLEWYPQPGEEKPPVLLLKDKFASERRKAKMLNFSIAYGKTPQGLAKDWKVTVKEATETVNLWYKQRQEVLAWQEERKKEAKKEGCVKTLLGRARCFPSMSSASYGVKRHIERAAINTPVQGSAADVAMCAMLEIVKNARLKELGWRLLLQVHDEVILEGPTGSAEEAKAIVVNCMSKPFDGKNLLKVDLSVDAKVAKNWYAAK